MKVRRTQELLERMREYERTRRRLADHEAIAELQEFCEAHGIAYEQVIAKEERRIDGEQTKATNGHGPPQRGFVPELKSA